MTDDEITHSTLQDLRREIDRLDRVILEAISARFRLTGRVAATKHDGAIFRPGREADLLRGLLAAKDDHLDPRLIEGVWRQLIAFSLAGQKQLTIAHAGGDAITATARYRFGDVARYQGHDTAAAVLDAVASGQVDLGVLPHWEDAPWWHDLAARRQSGSKVAIAAVTPLVAESSLERSAILAPHMPDPSHDDMTLCHENGEITMIAGYHPERPNVVGIFQQH